MNINTNKDARVGPFKVVILDAMDAYYYADVMDKMELYSEVADYGVAVALADALFVTHNWKWESLAEMNSCDGGYDVRVYNSDMSCLYAAHTRYKDRWIGAE